MNKDIIFHIISIFNGIDIDNINLDERVDCYTAADKVSRLLKIILYRLENFKYNLMNNKENEKFTNSIIYPITNNNVNLLTELICDCLKNDVPDFDVVFPSKTNIINVNNPNKMTEIIDVLECIDKWRTTRMTDSITQ